MWRFRYFVSRLERPWHLSGMGRNDFESTVKDSTLFVGPPVRVVRVSPETPIQSPWSRHFQMAPSRQDATIQK